MSLDRKPFYTRHHDDEWFDEVHIVCVPRWKTSGLSGSEWRVSYRVQFLRKGQVLKERSHHRLQDLLAHLPSMLFYYAPADRDDDLGDAKFQGENDYCFQPGCPNKGTVEYELKSEYCHLGEAHIPHATLRRKFCEEHKHRGDCGLEDADSNYVLIVPSPLAESPLPQSTKEKLGRALDIAGFPLLAARARNGEFSDFEGPHAAPKVQLVTELLKRAGGAAFAERVKAGEFDDTKEESEAWFRRETQTEH